jgi:hypothetical protein
MRPRRFLGLSSKSLRENGDPMTNQFAFSLAMASCITILALDS